MAQKQTEIKCICSCGNEHMTEDMNAPLICTFEDCKELQGEEMEFCEAHYPN